MSDYSLCKSYQPTENDNMASEELRYLSRDELIVRIGILEGSLEYYKKQIETLKRANGEIEQKN